MCFIVLSFVAEAQSPVVGAEQVQDIILHHGKAFIIDVRSQEEYREEHVPGSITIAAERISAERARLPKDKNRTIIFYCRGAG